MSTSISDFLYGGVYLAACRFANIERFIDLVAAEIDLNVVTDADAAAEMIRGLADRLSVDTTIQDDESAKIHEAEAAVYSGMFRKLDLPRGNWNDDTTWLLGSFCNAYLPSHVFTPLEVVLVDQVDEGLALREICRRANVPDSVGVPILKRLGSQSALFVCDGESIAYSNVQHYLSMGEQTSQPVIRYLPPPGKAPQE